MDNKFKQSLDDQLFSFMTALMTALEELPHNEKESKVLRELWYQAFEMRQQLGCIEL